MKKKIFSFMGVAAFAVAITFNVNTGLNSNNQIDVTLASIEALAGLEGEIGMGCRHQSGSCVQGI